MGNPQKRGRQPKKRQPTKTQEAATTVKGIMSPDASKHQPGLGQTSEVNPTNPADEEQNLEAKLTERVPTEEAKPATNESIDEYTPAEEDKQDEGKPAEEAKLVADNKVRSYRWMWGDCNPLAALNPLRWSEYQSAESMIHDLRRQQSMHRPVNIKDQTEGSWFFTTAEQAISAMTTAVETGGQPCTPGQPTEDAAKPPKNDQE